MADHTEDMISTKSLGVPPSLSVKVARGGLWLFSLQILNRGIAFFRTIILARLLSPSDFGLFGIAVLAISTLEILSQIDFQTAIIQKKENIESYLETAWSVSVIRGALLFIILYSGAPKIAQFFNTPHAESIIRVISISTLISGFANIGVTLFKKELEFKKQFIYEISSTLINFTVGVSLALILKNAWALVWSGLSSNLARVIVSFIIHDYRPRLVFRKDKFKQLFEFARWVMATTILLFLLTKGDDIFVGKILGITQLGLYQIAFLISNLPATEVTHIVSQITFPAYSKIQDDMLRLKEGFIRVLSFTAFVSIPFSIIIFTFSHEITYYFLGEKWLPVVPSMQILCVYGLFRSFGALPGNVITAMGRVHLLPIVPAFQLVVLAVIIYPLTVKYQFAGVCLSVTASTIFGVVFAYFIGNRLLSIRFSTIMWTISPYFVSSIIPMILYRICKNFIAANFYSFITCAIVWIALYLLLQLKMSRHNILLDLFNSFKG